MVIDNWKDKLKGFKKKLEDDPNDGKLWYEYGAFLEEECDNPERTIYAFEKAQKLLPSMDFRLRIGAAYASAGNLEKGILLIKQNLNESPDAAGYCILADVYLNNDMCLEATDACKKALEINPNYEEAYYLYGESVKNGSREQAIRHYKKAIKIDKNYQLAWQALGRELVVKTESIEEGLSALKIAIELDAEDGWAKIYMANALWRIGDVDKADKYYREAISTFPDYPEFRKWYKEFLKKTGRKGQWSP